MKVHCCPLDRQCRSYSAPARVYITTKRRHINIALTPGSRTVVGPPPWRLKWVVINPKRQTKEPT